MACRSHRQLRYGGLMTLRSQGSCALLASLEIKHSLNHPCADPAHPIPGNAEVSKPFHEIHCKILQEPEALSPIRDSQLEMME